MTKRYRGMDADARALAAYVRFVRAGDCAARETTRPLALYGLDSTEFGILESLEDAGPQSPAELARRNLRSGGSLAAGIAKLRRRGLVARRAGGGKRAAEITLTRKGRTLARSIFPGHASAIVAFMNRLSPREQEALSRLSAKLARPR